MPIHTPLCDFLGTRHPIMLAGMGGVSYAELAAAMCNAGGYGVLGMAGTSPDFIADQIAKVKQLTDKPFGVDLLAADPRSLEQSVDVIIEGGADSFVAGLGVPMPIMKKLKDAGVKVMVVGGAVKHAVKAEQAGCDAVILQGGEGGGHTGLVGTLPLVAQAVEAVNIPVVAAGGIYDGRGLAAALSLGAVGVWMGTRFIASAEAHAAQDAQRLARALPPLQLLERGVHIARQHLGVGIGVAIEHVAHELSQQQHHPYQQPHQAHRDNRGCNH
ncbi:MAG: nitronate monooxygenase, partial [Pseudomonadota bacterium]|nr:nitronate monooxygenase [Pseudomonadota bacterium]